MIRRSVTLPEDIINEIQQYTDNFSGFVAAALREYLKAQKIAKAKQSFGSWANREHDSIEMVNELRTAIVLYPL
ncbi:MAG: type II toxin-antitoxin system CcdA family antitoxin [Nitrospirota bacterium]